MRLMTIREMNKVFHLRIRGNKRRVRKKNHHRALKYINKFGLICVDMNNKKESK